jgi:valyl-tRNA synthetase
MAKPRWGEDADVDVDDRRTARWVSWTVLDGLLRLLHPFMPHVTEEIWQAIPHDGDLLAMSQWPAPDPSWRDADVEAQIEYLQEFVVAVRNLRAEMSIAPGKPIRVVLRGEAEQLLLIERLADQLKPLARIETIDMAGEGQRPAASASALVRGTEVFVPLAGLIDLEVEQKRLQKQIDKAAGEIDRMRKKLRNQDFLAKARADVVSREKQRLSDLEASLAKLEKAQENLKSAQA